MFSAWAANAMGLRALQKYIKSQIEQRSTHLLTMGPLITISQSAHIYDDTFESVDQIIKQHYQSIINKELLDYCDPVGNFLVDIECDEIIVTRTTPGSGEVVGRYSGKLPLPLVRKICSDSPGIKPDHVAYLGIELQKAYDCIKLGKNYTQDQ
jgi:thymidylate synthase